MEKHILKHAIIYMAIVSCIVTLFMLGAMYYTGQTTTYRG